MTVLQAPQKAQRPVAVGVGGAGHHINSASNLHLSSEVVQELDDTSHGRWSMETLCVLNSLCERYAGREKQWLAQSAQRFDTRLVITMFDLDCDSVVV